MSSGLFVKNERGEVYDRFRRRLMFPIWNERGKTIGFGGRALAADAQPKYLNSPESALYSKSYVLYALHLAREAAQKAGRLVVVEGYFDCLSLHQAGIENVVASCGTSLTQQQVAMMARYVPEVVMNYDPDAAGQKAMRRSIDLLLAKGLRIRILKLSGGLDPGFDTGIVGDWITSRSQPVFTGFAEANSTVTVYAEPTGHPSPAP